MTDRRASRPPKHLRPTTRRWFNWVLDNFDMEEHHVKLHTAASESWDRMQQAREASGQHGITYTDRFGAPKPRPEVAIERDAKIVFSRMIRELRLDLEGSESRPPGLGEK